MNPPNLG